MGGKLYVVLNQVGLVVRWGCDTAKVHDTVFTPLIAPLCDHMVMLADRGFHRAQGDLSHLKLCRRGEWNGRMQVETVLSMLTGGAISNG